MLRKVEMVVMEPTTDSAQLIREIDAFELAGKYAAFFLHTLAHLPFARENGRIVGIAEKLFAIVGFLPALKSQLSMSIPDAPVFSPEQVAILSRSVGECDWIIKKIGEVVQEVDTRVPPLPGKDGDMQDPSRVIDAFPPDLAGSAQSTLHECFHNIVVAVSAARAEQLSRRGYLSDWEFVECLRLREALKHPEYKKIPGLAISPPLPGAPAPINLPQPGPLCFPTPVARPPSPPPYQARDIIDLQHPIGFRGRYGHPDFPLREKGRQVQLWPADPAVKFDKSFEEAEADRHRWSAEGKYPNVCMFGCWPPHFVAQNSIQDYQLRSLLPEGYKHENMDAPPPTVPSAGSPVVTPHSTRENTPAAGHDDTTHVDASEATGAETVPDTKSQTSSSDSKSTPKPEESAEKDPKLSSGSTQGPSEKPETEQASEKKANVVTSTQHAAPESGASISGDAKPAKPDDASLSPPSGGIGLALPTRTVAPNRTDSSLNLEAYILRPLCEDIHQAIKLTYKIEQLRLDDEEIQAHMRKLGLDHSVLDTLGELHSEQLRLIQIHAKDRHGYIMAVQHGRPVDLVTKMGTFQVKPVIFVLKAARPPENESGPETTNTQANAVHPPLFGNPLPAPSAFCGFGSGPLSMNNNTSLTAEDYRQQLEFRGEPCTHIEPDGRVPQGLQHFQSIKPYFRKDISFEEVRKADMEAGRTGLTNSNGFAGYPWDKSTPSTLGGGGLFGTKPSATTEGGYKEYVDLSRNKQLTGGLFGTPSSSRDPLNLFGQRPGGGLFGNSSSSAGFGQSNTSGGLFGGLTQRVNPGGGLFGSSSNTGGGLFGNLGQHTSTAGTSLSGVAPASSSGGGLFGSSNAQNNRPTSGLFGDPQPAPSSGPFGRAPSAPSTGLFGSAPAASPAPSTGLFGNTQTAQTSGLFGNAHSAPSSGLFGSTQAAPSGPHITGAFGSTPPAHPSGLSGTAPAPYVRGSARGGLFAGLCPTDNTPSPGLFGSARPNDQPKPSLFGNPSSQPKVTPGGLFPSSAPQGRASPFGAPSTSLSATDLFGKPVTHSSNAPSNVGYCGLSNSAPRTNAFDSSSASGFGTQSSSASNPNPFAPTPSSLGTGLFNIAPPPSTNPSFANSFAAPPPTAPGPNPFTAAPKPSTTPSQASGTTAPEPTTTGDNASSTLANRKTCTVCCTHLIFHTAAEQASKICDNCADKASTTPCIYCQFANLSTIGPATEVPTDQVTNHYAKNGKHVVCDTCRKDICLHREAEQQARRCDACARVEETECDHCKLAILNKTIGKGARKVPASSSFATSGTPAKTTDEDAGAAAELKSGAEASKEDHAKEETREAGEAKSVEAGNKHARVEDEDDEDSVDV